jgi:hypothetical protein
LYGLRGAAVRSSFGGRAQRRVDLTSSYFEGVTSALKSGAIRKLADGGGLQLDLFDERNLIAFTHDDFPGERLVACRNPDLARLRAAKRNDLIAATVAELDKVAAMVASGRLQGRARIGARVGSVINKYKVAKRFELRFEDASFSYRPKTEQIAADGLYVIRTSVAESDMSAEAAVFTRLLAHMATIVRNTMRSASDRISDRLMTELTAHRTLALREAVANDPDTAFLAMLHASSSSTDVDAAVPKRTAPFATSARAACRSSPTSPAGPWTIRATRRCSRPLPSMTCRSGCTLPSPRP